MGRVKKCWAETKRGAGVIILESALQKQSPSSKRTFQHCRRRNSKRRRKHRFKKETARKIGPIHSFASGTKTLRVGGGER